MKSLLLLALVSGMAHADLSHQLIKVLDGSSASCASRADVFQHQFGAYRLQAQGGSVQGEKLRLNLKAEFFQCDEFGRSIGFAARGVTESFEQTVYSNVRGVEKTTIETKSAEIVSYRDGVYRPVLKSEISGARVTLVAELKELLSAAEYEALHAGDSVKLSLDSFLTKVVTDRRVAGEIPVSFGAFRSHVELKLVNGAYQVRLR